MFLIRFVSQQSEFAFFGARASVCALFIFKEKDMSRSDSSRSYTINSKISLINRYDRIVPIKMFYKGISFNISPVIFRMMQGDMCAAMRQLDKLEGLTADDRFDILCKIHRTFIKYEQV